MMRTLSAVAVGLVPAATTPALVAHRDEQMLGEQALHKDSAEQQQVAWEAAQSELNAARGFLAGTSQRRRINGSRNATSPPLTPICKV